MKKFIRKIPLDTFIDRMNSLGKPFTVVVFFYSSNKNKDVGYTELECHLIEARCAVVTFRGNHSIVHIDDTCGLVEWNDDNTMMCYVLECEEVIACVYTPDGKPLKEI